MVVNAKFHVTEIAKYSREFSRVRFAASVWNFTEVSPLARLEGSEIVLRNLPDEVASQFSPGQEIEVLLSLPVKEKVAL